MRIHSDTLTIDDLTEAARAIPGGHINITEHGSRKRDHAFEVNMFGDPGKDRHGIARSYYSNGGSYGANTGPYRALTWVEWGDWMVELLKIDPGAIIGSYVGQPGFLTDTWYVAGNRPARENAEVHKERWSRELYAAADRDKEAIRDPYAPQVERHTAFCRHNLRSNPEGSRR